MPLVKDAVNRKSTHPTPCVLTHGTLHVHAAVQLLEGAVALGAPRRSTMLAQLFPFELLLWFALLTRVIHLPASRTNLNLTYLAFNC